MLLLPADYEGTNGNMLPAEVAIPYSSGMLLLHMRAPVDSAKATSVAIPYSSGMLLLRVAVTNFNVAVNEKWSQSPIHRECFCYP